MKWFFFKRWPFGRRNKWGAFEWNWTGKQIMRLIMFFDIVYRPWEEYRLTPDVAWDVATGIWMD